MYEVRTTGVVMIIPMSKVLILIYHSSVDTFLTELKKLGLIHIDIHPSADDTEAIEKAKKISRIKNVLKDMKGDTPHQIPHDNPFHIVEKYDNLRVQLEQTRARVSITRNQIKKQEVWGDFDPEKIRALSKETGMHIKFLIIPKKKYIASQWNEFYYTVIYQTPYRVYVMLFEKETQFDPVSFHAEEIPLPEQSLSALRRQEIDLIADIERIRIDLEQLRQFNNALGSLVQDEMGEFEFSNVKKNLPGAVENKIFILNGWIPVEKKHALEEKLKKHDIAYVISKPEISDTVPILLKNNRFSKLFEPITRLFELPHYRELDLTPMFAPFFALFFGLCLGDAGYGLIIFIVSLILKHKFDKKYSGIFILGQILGGVTCAIGLITGTVFGVDISGIEILKGVVLFTQDQLFYIALVIGIVQVLFGMIIKVINRMKQFGFVSSLSTMGWILIIIGGLIKFGIHIDVGLYVIFTGVFLILFFNDMKVNIFVRLGKGLWELYGVTGVFGDILSYIRLFALGISSSILGFVVNDIGMQMKSIPWIGFILAFIFLVIGHTGNLLISSLGSFVHPLRLTFVEFYKNAGFAGGGKAYRPFGR